uniref:Uncharacterized protein n=1 Tax=Arundo donax TaxID=35708 RepID=A0A0A9AG22_ARUDO
MAEPATALPAKAKAMVGAKVGREANRSAEIGDIGIFLFLMPKHKG